MLPEILVSLITLYVTNLLLEVKRRPAYPLDSQDQQL